MTRTPRPARSRGSRTRFPIAVGILWVVAGACSDEGSELFDPNPSCGDTLCDPDTCETSLRCETDCGTCTGDACNPPGDDFSGTCGKSCTDSCGCLQAGQVCTADYGDPNGICLPVGCGLCPQGKHCDYTVDATGRCSGGICVAD